MSRNKITDNSNNRHYRVEIPHLVRFICRGPQDYALWSTVKEVAGETGECYLGTDDLATLSGMSKGKAADCRAFLLAVGLLQGEKSRSGVTGHEVWHLVVPDLWPANIAWRQQNQSLKKRIADKAALTALYQGANNMLRKFDPADPAHKDLAQSVHNVTVSGHNMNAIMVKRSQYERNGSQCERKRSHCGIKEEPQEKPQEKPDSNYSGATEQIFDIFSRAVVPLNGTDRVILQDLIGTHGEDRVLTIAQQSQAVGALSLIHLRARLAQPVPPPPPPAADPRRPADEFRLTRQQVGYIEQLGIQFNSHTIKEFERQVAGLSPPPGETLTQWLAYASTETEWQGKQNGKKRNLKYLLAILRNIDKNGGLNRHKLRRQDELEESSKGGGGKGRLSREANVQINEFGRRLSQSPVPTGITESAEDYSRRRAAEAGLTLEEYDRQLLGL